MIDQPTIFSNRELLELMRRAAGDRASIEQTNHDEVIIEGSLLLTKLADDLNRFLNRRKRRDEARREQFR